MTPTQRILRATVLALAVAGLTGGCGSRPSYWNDPVATYSGTYPLASGLVNGVALVDDAAHRVVIVGALGDQEVTRTSFPVGHNVTSVTTSPDRTHLFVLSSGDWPPQSATDEFPSLTVIGYGSPGSLPTATTPPTSTRYAMSLPLPNLAIDPAGTYAVAYTGAGAGPLFIDNPNAIAIFALGPNPSLPTGASNPVSRTILSLGGTPQQLVFTPDLLLPASGNPAGAHTRLLLIESTIDLTLVDLGHAFDPIPPQGITVPLTNGTSAQVVTPAGLVVSDGDPNDPNDASIALWTTNDSNIYLFQLGPSAGTPNPFVPTINLVPVGGVPSQVAFVHTTTVQPGCGLKMAALIPSTSTALLIDQQGDPPTQVALPAAYSQMSLVTSVASTGSTGSAGVPCTPDVALLWAQASTPTLNGNFTGVASGVAFWSVGNTVGGISVVNVSQPIQAVDDVPSSHLKVLELANTGGFVVLDLAAQTASPLTIAEATTIAIAPDGLRMWAFVPGGTQLAAIEFPLLNILPLTTSLPISGVFDVARPPLAGSTKPSRALIATHAQGSWGATVFDALTPATASAREATSLLLEATP